VSILVAAITRTGASACATHRAYSGPGRVPSQQSEEFPYLSAYIIPPLYIMGGSLRKKFRFRGHSGGGSRKVLWPSSGTGLVSSRVPELTLRDRGMGHRKFGDMAGSPPGTGNLTLSRHIHMNLQAEVQPTAIEQRPRQEFRYRAGNRPAIGRISFFGLRTLYPLCTLWGVACAKSSDSVGIRAGVVGKFSGRFPVHGWVPARYRNSVPYPPDGATRVPVPGGFPGVYRNSARKTSDYPRPNGGQIGTFCAARPP